MISCTLSAAVTSPMPANSPPLQHRTSKQLSAYSIPARNSAHAAAPSLIAASRIMLAFMLACSGPAPAHLVSVTASMACIHTSSPGCNAHGTCTRLKQSKTGHAAGSVASLVCTCGVLCCCLLPQAAAHILTVQCRKPSMPISRGAATAAGLPAALPAAHSAVSRAAPPQAGGPSAWPLPLRCTGGAAAGGAGRPPATSLGTRWA